VPELDEQQEPGRSLLTRWLAGEGFVASLVVLCVLITLPFAPSLLTPGNIANDLANLWPLAIIVVGQTFVLLLGGIDLSQTAVMAVGNTFGALLVTQALNPAVFEKSPLWGTLIGEDGGPFARAGGAGVAATVVAVILVGALMGTVNGLAVAKLGMPPFMVTLGTLLFASAFAIWMTKSENVTALPPQYLALGGAGFGPFLTIPMVIALAVAIGCHYILSRTTLGAWFYAAGSKREVAIISGVPYDRIVVSAYILSSSCAALGGLLYSLRLEAGRPTLGANLLLDVIGAAVIGGISLFGGKGTVLGAFLGALFFIVLANCLNLLNLPFFVVMMVKGAVIIGAALLDLTRTRILGGAR